jgi:hypothetical protein
MTKRELIREIEKTKARHQFLLSYLSDMQGKANDLEIEYDECGIKIVMLEAKLKKKKWGSYGRI